MQVVQKCEPKPRLPVEVCEPGTTTEDFVPGEVRTSKMNTKGLLLRRLEESKRLLCK